MTNKKNRPPLIPNQSKDNQQAPDQSPDQDDSLCSYCANKEECSGHHMMCIDYKPANKEQTT